MPGRVPEDTEHVFFWYQGFTDKRKELEDTLGSISEPETLVKLMFTTVMKRLREEEQEHRKTRRPTITVPRNKQREN